MVNILFRDYDSFIALIRDVIQIKNTNNTFIVKLIGKLIGKVKTVNSIYNKLTELCEEIIKFCEESNNLSMKNRIQTRLAQIHYLNAGYTKALELTAKTLIDLKRYEDNLGLIEIQLIESKIHFATKGIAKAKVKRYI